MNFDEKCIFNSHAASKSLVALRTFPLLKTTLVILHRITQNLFLHFNLWSWCNNWEKVLCNVPELCPLTHFQLPHALKISLQLLWLQTFTWMEQFLFIIFHILNKVCGEQTFACCFSHSPVGQTRYSMWLRTGRLEGNVSHQQNHFNARLKQKHKNTFLKHHRYKHILPDAEQLWNDSSQRQHLLISHTNKTCVQVKSPVAWVNFWLFCYLPLNTYLGLTVMRHRF